MPQALALTAELESAKVEIARLRAELADLQLLYQATIEHGEAVEDELAEKNLLLQRTQSRLDAELAEAAGYILSILPPPRREPPRTDWLMIPSTELGGDSFGHHEIDEDHLAFYLLDVCGHGVGAALLSVTAINVLRSCSLPNTDFREPDAVLAALNEAFPMERQHNMYFTIWYGVYRRSTRTLRYTSAGHPPAVHLRGAAPARALPLITFGIAPGSFPGLHYRCEALQVEPGDRLILLSDGCYEVPKPDGRMLSFEELAAFLAAGGEAPQSVLDWVRSLNGPGPLPDDFSLLRVTF